MALWEKLALAALKGAIKEGEKEVNKALQALEHLQPKEESQPIQVEVVESKKKV